jgi:hypothetical protein
MACVTESAPLRERAAAVAALERAVAGWAAGGEEPRASEVAAVRVVVLVEGASDRAAVRTAAEVSGLEPADEGIAVVPMGGAMSARRFAGVLRRRGAAGSGPDPELRGLCDAAERRFYERAGLTDAAISVCRPDLEGELLAALGLDAAEEVLARQGDLRLFRVFQNQPAQRGRATGAQLHRFLGTTSGRKERYGRLLAAALPAERIPAPLLAVLASPGRRAQRT